MQGLITCARYAYSPNQLGYCGPDKNNNLQEYISSNVQDAGLKEILVDFQTLKPYLTFISQANRIPDAFNQRVVEAYWIGNSLLQNISANDFYRYLNDGLSLPKKLNRKSLNYLYDKLPLGAKPHHSFHVLNIFRRTGHLSIEHTVETMDNCCINWGRVMKIKPSRLLVQYRPLVLEQGKLAKGDFCQKEISHLMNCQSAPSKLEEGNLVTFHWNAVCEKIDPIQTRNLDFYTKQAIDLANLTL